MPELVDTHCHLNFERFDDDRKEVIERALKAGVKRIIAPAIDLETSEQVIRLAEEYDTVYAAVGIHPNTNVPVGQVELGQLRALSDHPKVVAIGEIGLDYYHKHTSHERQHSNLAAQLELASVVKLPVIIHNRESSDDVLRMLGDWRERAGNDGLEGRAGVLHSFSTGWEYAQSAFEVDFFIGFTGPLTYRNADLLRAVAANAPSERILIETDAPFLTPEPLNSQRNEPAYVQYVAEKLAEVREVEVDEMARVTTENAFRLFGWSGKK